MPDMPPSDYLGRHAWNRTKIGGLSVRCTDQLCYASTYQNPRSRIFRVRVRFCTI